MFDDIRKYRWYQHVAYWIIIGIGLLPLAFLMEWYKANIGDNWWRFLVALVYLLALRYLIIFIARKFLR